MFYIFNEELAEIKNRPCIPSHVHRVIGSAHRVIDCIFYKFIYRELPLRKGDTVYLLQHLDRNWFKGERHGAVGVFPVNYVEVSD